METGLLRDSDWEPLHGEYCRVTTLTPLGFAKGTPYASIEIESRLLTEPTTGFVTHKLDFEHLTKAFSRMESEPNTEVLIVWTKQRFRRGVKRVARFMPRMLVMLCRKNAYELLINDETYKPELSGMERYRAMMPIAEWGPDVMQ